MTLGLIIALLAAPWMPNARWATIGILFVGMILRTRTCATSPSGNAGLPPSFATMLVPAWPALVGVGHVWTWSASMDKVNNVRVPLTSILFIASWISFIDTTPWWAVPALAVSGVATALLRDRADDLWYLVPTVVPFAMFAFR